MKIWKQDFSLEGINSMGKNTLVSHIGIEFIEIGNNYLKAKMPVDARTVQPMRLLHGGASVVLAETIGSVATTMCIDDWSKNAGVGIEINANHIRSAKSGFVIATATPIKLGRTLHVWRIVIEREDGKQVCESRITMAIIDIKKTK
jgi:1,4-dihydroxy-2-naphthoyl-CoA hydrolase